MSNGFDFQKEKEQLERELAMLKHRNEEFMRINWLKNEKLFSNQMIFWFLSVIFCFIFWLASSQFFFSITDWLYQFIITSFVTFACLWIMLKRYLWWQSEYLQLDESKFYKFSKFCAWFYDVILNIVFFILWLIFWIKRKPSKDDRQLRRAARLKLEAEWNELRYYWQTDMTKEAYIKARLDWLL